MARDPASPVEGEVVGAARALREPEGGCTPWPLETRLCAR